MDFQLDVVKKLRSLSQEFWGIQCDWGYLLFYVKILEQVVEETYVRLLWKKLILCKTKMAH
jgi:hypothetical protein